MADLLGNMVATWSGTGVGTNAGVTVTKAAVTGQRHSCAGIQCSGDAAALVTIESPSGTPLFSKRYAAAFTMSEAFPPGALLGSLSGAMLVKISASTSNSEANIQGFSQ
jgi:hypothetical protein